MYIVHNTIQFTVDGKKQVITPSDEPVELPDDVASEALARGLASAYGDESAESDTAKSAKKTPVKTAE